MFGLGCYVDCCDCRWVGSMIFVVGCDFNGVVCVVIFCWFWMLCRLVCVWVCCLGIGWVCFVIADLGYDYDVANWLL